MKKLSIALQDFIRLYYPGMAQTMILRLERTINTPGDNKKDLFWTGCTLTDIRCKLKAVLREDSETFKSINPELNIMRFEIEESL